MNRITTFLLGIITGAVGLYVSENYYIVRSKDAVHLVPKVAAKLEFPYRDIRNYSVEDWQANPSVGLAIVSAKKQDLLLDSGINGLQSQFEGLLQSIGGS